MINFTNFDDFGVKNKKLTDCEYFGYNDGVSRSIYMLAQVYEGKAQYIIFHEHDDYKRVYVSDYNENMTFYQAFGDNYINIVILDDVDIHIDAKIIQMAEKD